MNTNETEQDDEPRRSLSGSSHSNKEEQDGWHSEEPPLLEEEQQQPDEEEEDEEWSQFLVTDPPQQNDHIDMDDRVIFELPPQLHPAVSAGMRHITSCYFSMDDHSSHGGSSSQQQQQQGALPPTNSLWSFLDCVQDAAVAGNNSSNMSNSNNSVASSGWNEASDDNKNDSNCPATEQKDEPQQSATKTNSNSTSSSSSTRNTLLYHDILMQVFGYLDTDSLAAFSETATRPNFEVFYYLQLQLQRSVLCTSGGGASGNNNTKSDSNHVGLSPVAGLGRLQRLARTQPNQAQDIIQQYLESNASLRQMPLSHSLEYIRQWLQQSRFNKSNRGNTARNATAEANGADAQQQPSAHSSSSFSGAALLIALIGAASLTMNSDHLLFEQVKDELPHVLFRVGFVGSLMSAARSLANSTKDDANDDASSSDNTNANANNNTNNNMPRLVKQQAEQMARNLRQALTVLYQNDDNDNDDAALSLSLFGPQRVLTRMMRAAYVTAYGDTPLNKLPRHGSFLSSPNPYDHWPVVAAVAPQAEQEQQATSNDHTPTESTQQPLSPPPQQPRPNQMTQNQEISTTNTTEAVVHPPPAGTKNSKPNNNDNNINNQPKTPSPPKKTPTGCVGAYRRAISKATQCLVDSVKEERLKNYKALSDDEQRHLGTALLDACTLDHGLPEVKTIVKQGIDVEDFYVASDGTETSALHAAAFSGNASILEFLCQGLQDDDNRDENDTYTHSDGGLCNVNLKDSNGWTALHFAAGANSTESVRILARHGADLTVEAANGYTPWQWAVRLQNTAVADELKQLQTERRLERETAWPPDLTRFFFGTVQT